MTNRHKRPRKGSPQGVRDKRLVYSGLVAIAVMLGAGIFAAISSRDDPAPEELVKITALQPAGLASAVASAPVRVAEVLDGPDGGEGVLIDVGTAADSVLEAAPVDDAADTAEGLLVDLLPAKSQRFAFATGSETLAGQSMTDLFMHTGAFGFHSSPQRGWVPNLRTAGNPSWSSAAGGPAGANSRSGQRPSNASAPSALTPSAGPADLPDQAQGPAVSAAPRPQTGAPATVPASGPVPAAPHPAGPVVVHEPKTTVPPVSPSGPGTQHSGPPANVSPGPGTGASGPGSETPPAPVPGDDPDSVALADLPPELDDPEVAAILGPDDGWLSPDRVLGDSKDATPDDNDLLNGNERLIPSQRQATPPLASAADTVPVPAPLLLLASGLLLLGRLNRRRRAL